MKRRRRGPRGSAFFDLADGDLRHFQSRRATCATCSRAMTIEESGSICVKENPSPLGGTPSHTAAAEGYHDRRRFFSLACSGYFLVTSRRHRRELCPQEVANGGCKESHTVDPRGHPSKRIANRFVRFQANLQNIFTTDFGHMFQYYLADADLLIQSSASQ